MIRLPRPRLPVVRKSRLLAALAENGRLLAQAETRDAQQKTRGAAERRALVASLVADYYRALAAADESLGDETDARPRRHRGTDQFVGIQFGIMDHCVTMLARLTGKDSVRVEWNLSAGLPVDDTPTLPGGEADRLAALTEPYRTRNAGAFAHLPVERGGPGQTIAPEDRP